MRDIKFRAYDKFNKVMTYSDKNYPLSKYSIEFNWKNNNKMSLLMLIDPRCGEMREYDADIMQYTGLKDKNGKEIYEGDILGEKGSKLGVLGIVKFEQGCFIAGCEFLFSIYNDYEVLGNIYENKDLLK